LRNNKLASGKASVNTSQYLIRLNGDRAAQGRILRKTESGTDEANFTYSDLLKKKRWRKMMEEKKYQTNCECDTAKRIKGIMCDVKNCAYHNGKSECCAGCISVGPSSAESSSATACVTFKPKAY